MAPNAHKTKYACKLSKQNNYSTTSPSKLKLLSGNCYSSFINSDLDPIIYE